MARYQQSATKRIKIPHEIYMRLDDVDFHVPNYWDQCTQEQKDRLIEEAKHLSELISDGGSIYEGISAYSIKRSADVFLKKITEVR